MIHREVNLQGNEHFTYPDLSNKKQRTSIDNQTLTFTPPISNKLRLYAKDYEATLRAKFRYSVSENGTSKWIMKSSMKMLCQAPLNAEAIKSERNDEISRLKAYTIAEDIKLNDGLRQNFTKRRKIDELLKKYQQVKKHSLTLKKLIVLEDLKMKRRAWLEHKSKVIDHQLQILMEDIRLLEIRLGFNYQQCQIAQKSLIQFSQCIESRNKNLQALEKEFAQLQQKKAQKDSQFSQMARTSMPNQRQIISCMFSIGILAQQIYILQLEKNIRKNFSCEKGIEIINRKAIHQHVIEQQAKRCIRINCSRSQIVTFKIFTLIYMHCRSLCLANLIPIMKKTTYFSEQFSKIYEFQNYQAYMKQLIQNYKGNYDGLTYKSHDTAKKEQKKLFLRIVTKPEDVEYTRWVLGVFRLKENHFFINFECTGIHIDVLTTEEATLQIQQISNIKKDTHVKHFLKLSLHGSERN